MEKKISHFSAYDLKTKVCILKPRCLYAPYDEGNIE